MTVLFDFDKWMRLAQEEPRRFEKLRRQIIEQQIRASSPSSQKRLRGLQFQIDSKRRLSGSAMGACIAISGMMFDHLYNEFLPALYAAVDDDIDAFKSSRAENSSVILNFPRNKYKSQRAIS